MAGLTHSAFRRVVSAFGGCDLLYTEMLAGAALLQETPDSPYLKQRPGDAPAIFQLLLRDERRIEAIVARLHPCHPAGLDLNCACPNNRIRQAGGGASLLEDPERLRAILCGLRQAWGGRLSVKLRLGPSPVPRWRENFQDRLRLIEDCGVDAISINPRFAEDRHARAARHDLLPWICALTRLPVTANGDILGPETIARNPANFAACAGLMLGRIAIVRPWTFAAWRAVRPLPAPRELALQTWQSLAAGILEDFPPEKALEKLKLFAVWFSRNYAFGHTFYTAVRNAPDWTTLHARAEAFFAANPEVVLQPSLVDY